MNEKMRVIRGPEIPLSELAHGAATNDWAVRIEHDSMGEVSVPARAYYGAQTQRAVENFPISGGGLAARADSRPGPGEMGGRRGQSRPGQADRLRQEPAQRQTGRGPAGRLPRSGRGKARRPIPDRRLSDRLGHLEQHERQRGDQPTGRSSCLGGDRFAAEKPIHPNDHVNMGQSTNDMFPTAIHVAVAVGIRKQLIPALTRLRRRAGRQGGRRGTRSSRSAARTWPTPRRCAWARRSAAWPGS